jgi:hypothetical protein
VDQPFADHGGAPRLEGAGEAARAALGTLYGLLSVRNHEPPGTFALGRAGLGSSRDVSYPRSAGIPVTRRVVCAGFKFERSGSDSIEAIRIVHIAHSSPLAFDNCNLIA